MPDIQALAARVQDLTDKVDFWNRWMLLALITAAIAAVFVVVTTRLAIVRSKQLTIAQGELERAKDRVAESDSKSKDVAINETKLAAAGANERASKLEAANMGLQSDLEKQKERTAVAEKNLIELQGKIKARRLSPEQIDAIKSVLSKYPPRSVEVMVYMGAEDGSIFGQDIVDAINDDKNGWRASGPVITSDGGKVTGVSVLVWNPDPKLYPAWVMQVQEALHAARLQPGWDFNFRLPKDAVEVFVGPNKR